LLSSWIDKVLGPRPVLAEPEGLGPDKRTAVVLWSAAFLLVLLIFKAGFSTPGALYSGWESISNRGLIQKLYWVAVGVVFYFLVPLAIIVFVFKESPARYGMRIRLTKKTAVFYITLIILMFPLLYWASGRPAFLRIYPFVKQLGPDWQKTILIWEAAYVLRFFCLEFFFRGYLLFALEAKLGYAAIAVSTLPYGVIHFGKPFPEALGAVFAGTILGFIALRTRTIIGGVIIHSSIAVLMDLFALWRKGFFSF
jgi:membrane protease YdiL (CAAX protease family)